jgi:hypothetical protein
VQVLRSDSKELANDARKEMDALLRKLHGRVPKAERFALRGELASLRKEVRQRCESRIVTLGVSGGRVLSRPFRDARRFPSTRL